MSTAELTARLAAELPGRVHDVDSTVYRDSLARVFFPEASRRHPSCVVTPRDTADVAAVRRAGDVDLAERSVGEGPGAGEVGAVAGHAEDAPPGGAQGAGGVALGAGVDDGLPTLVFAWTGAKAYATSRPTRQAQPSTFLWHAGSDWWHVGAG